MKIMQIPESYSSLFRKTIFLPVRRGMKSSLISSFRIVSSYTELMKLMVVAAKNSLINTFVDELGSVGGLPEREIKENKQQLFNLVANFCFYSRFQVSKVQDNLLNGIFIGGRYYRHFVLLSAFWEGV